MFDLKINMTDMLAISSHRDAHAAKQPLSKPSPPSSPFLSYNPPMAIYFSHRF